MNRPKQVLIIEDDKAILGALEKMIEREKKKIENVLHLEIHVARTFKEGLTALTTIKGLQVIAIDAHLVQDETGTVDTTQMLMPIAKLFHPKATMIATSSDADQRDLFVGLGCHVKVESKQELPKLIFTLCLALA